MAAADFRQTPVVGGEGRNMCASRQSEDAVAAASTAEEQAGGTLVVGLLEATRRERRTR